MPWSDAGHAGFLGTAHACFKPEGPDIANMKLSGINATEMGDRKQLLASFDHLKREVDRNETYRGADSSTQKALDVLTSSKLLDALDVSKEPEKVRARYGDGKPYQFQYDGAPTVNEHLLMARRFIRMIF